jgi:hypothetical protein
MFGTAALRHERPLSDNKINFCSLSSYMADACRKIDGGEPFNGRLPIFTLLFSSISIPQGSIHSRTSFPGPLSRSNGFNRYSTFSASPLAPRHAMPFSVSPTKAPRS